MSEQTEAQSKKAARAPRAEERRAAIRQVKEQIGLTLEEWCKRAGLKNSTAVGNFLRGESQSLSLSTLEPLARVAGVSVSELIGEGSWVAIRAVSAGKKALAQRARQSVAVNPKDERYTVTIEGKDINSKLNVTRAVVSQILRSALDG